MALATEKRTQVYLTEDQHRAATQLARDRGSSLAAVIREALELYLAREAGAGEARWEDDPAFELIGALDLPPLADEDLDRAIDRTVYE